MPDLTDEGDITALAFPHLTSPEVTSTPAQEKGAYSDMYTDEDESFYRFVKETCCDIPLNPCDRIIKTNEPTSQYRHEEDEFVPVIN